MKKIKTYDLETRLVEFAAECVFFSESIRSDYAGRYYKDQLIRSSGSAGLNYGEAIGSITVRDFVHKTSLVQKELKESRICLKILDRINYGKSISRQNLLNEIEELIAIIGKMISNKR